MNSRNLIKKNALLFAPMEGITDQAYRMAMQELYPEWDLFYTDFLRIPSEGLYSKSKILEHLGSEVFNSKRQNDKTIFQILASESSNTIESVTSIKDLGIDKLDLNLGCPSKKVNSHKGGAYLLSDHAALKKILLSIRETFPGFFSVKIRIGYRDDKLFTETLKLIEDCGVEAITLHARTRDQLYLGRADWKYIKQAVKTVNIPLIGNGDIWTVEDIENCFHETGCHAVMCARGALKTPWMAGLYKENVGRIHMINQEMLNRTRAEQIDLYFHFLEKHYIKNGYREEVILKRFKGLCQFIFEDFFGAESIRSLFLRSRELSEFKANLESLQRASVYA